MFSLATIKTDDYRYGFNGMESDDEIKGQGNSYTTEFRQYDSRLGRWLSIDPITHPQYSPYSAFDNNPIYYIDPEGADSKGENKSDLNENKKISNTDAKSSTSDNPTIKVESGGVNVYRGD